MKIKKNCFLRFTGVKIQLLPSDNNIKRLIAKPTFTFWLIIHAMVFLVTSFNIINASNKSDAFLLCFLLLTIVSVILIISMKNPYFILSISYYIRPFYLALKFNILKISFKFVYYPDIFMQAVPKQLTFVAYSSEINKLFKTILLNSEFPNTVLNPMKYNIKQKYTTFLRFH